MDIQKKQEAGLVKKDNREAVIVSLFLKDPKNKFLINDINAVGHKLSIKKLINEDYLRIHELAIENDKVTKSILYILFQNTFQFFGKDAEKQEVINQIIDLISIIKDSILKNLSIEDIVFCMNNLKQKNGIFFSANTVLSEIKNHFNEKNEAFVSKNMNEHSAYKQSRERKKEDNDLQKVRIEEFIKKNKNNG